MPLFSLKEQSKYVEFKVPILIGSDANYREYNVNVPDAFQRQILLATVQLTDEYPNKCPSVCLQQKLIYHPFIGQDSGSVCMSTRDKWSSKDANKKLVRILTLDIPQLLGTFEGENPHNTEALDLYTKSQKEYFDKARKVFKAARSAHFNAKDLQKMMFESSQKTYPQPFLDRAKEYGIELLNPQDAFQAVKLEVVKREIDYGDYECSGSI